MLNSTELRRLMYSLHTCKIGQRWGRTPAVEYWLQPSLVSQGVGTFTDGLFAVTSNGWVNTGTIIGVAGSGADFPGRDEHLWFSSVSAEMASDRGTPNHFAIDTAGDLLNSPAIFGDPTHMAIASELMGMKDLPVALEFETWSAFTANNDESASGIGFVEDGGAASVANDHFAAFVCTTTDFKLRSGAATSVALKAADTSFHRFKASVNRIDQLVYAYIDDMNTRLGSIAIEADELPVSFGAGCLTSTGANFPKLGPSVVRYVWM